MCNVPNFSFAAALLAAAFSGQALADGINNFSQAKAASVKVNADAPGSLLLRVPNPLAKGKKGVV
ncbi:DNA-specific endonuclease I, partial [Salmonella enterica subsp. enterica serovar Heidelberg str. 607310-1]